MYSSTSSGAITVNTQVTTTGCVVSGIQLTAGSTAATMSIYDGTSASGILLASISTPLSTTQPVPFNIPVSANKGVFVTITGTGATGIVHYAPGN